MSTVNDSFTRADESPLAAPWTTDSDFPFDLSGNKAIPNADGSDCAAIYNGTGAPTWGNDQSSKADLTTTGTGGGSQGIGLWVRHAAGTTKTGYRFVVDHASSTNCELQKFVAGVYTQIASFTQAWTNGDTWELRAVGTTITMWLNGTQVHSTTDSSVASGSPGLGYSSVGSGSSVVGWIGTDALSGTDASVTAVTADATGDVVSPTPSEPEGTDDFNRADGALGNLWQQWTIGTMPTIASNAATASGSGADTTRPEAIGPDSFCSATFVTAAGESGTEYSVGVRLSSHDASSNGYMLDMATGVPKLYRLDAGSFHTLATGSSQTSVGGIKVTAVGSTITGYYLLSGVWTQVAQTTDATYTGAGSPGFFVSQGSGPAVDAVSWGAASASGDASTTAPVIDGTGDIPNPTFSAGSSVTSPAVDGTGALPAANMAISEEVDTGPASGTGDIANPTVSGGTGSADATETAPVIDGTGGIPIPAVSGTADATVIAPVIDGTGDAPNTTQTTGAGPTAPTLAGRGDIANPTISGTTSTPNTADSMLMMGVG